MTTHSRYLKSVNTMHWTIVWTTVQERANSHRTPDTSSIPANQWYRSALLLQACIDSLRGLRAGLEYRYSNIDITEIAKLFSVIFWIPKYRNSSQANSVFYRSTEIQVPISVLYRNLKCLCRKILSKYFILASVLFVLYRDALVVERLRRLPRMQEVLGLNPTEGKICFSHFTLLEWNVKNCFV